MVVVVTVADAVMVVAVDVVVAVVALAVEVTEHDDASAQSYEVGEAACDSAHLSAW